MAQISLNIITDSAVEYHATLAALAMPSVTAIGDGAFAPAAGDDAGEQSAAQPAARAAGRPRKATNSAGSTPATTKPDAHPQQAEKPADPAPAVQAEKPVEQSPPAGDDLDAMFDDKPAVTMEQMREALVKLARGGKPADAKKITIEVGKAEKVSEIDPANYAAVYAAANAALGA